VGGGGVQVGLGLFGFPGSGFDIADNSYSGNVAGPGLVPRDVWLTGTSSNTVVTERSGTVVLDQGTGNSVNTLADDGNDYCAD
jgi:hypothetical protein